MLSTPTCPCGHPSSLRTPAVKLVYSIAAAAATVVLRITALVGARHPSPTSFPCHEYGAVSIVRDKLRVEEGKAHPTISAKKERASHGFVGYNVHPNHEGRGRRAIVVELDGHSGRSVRAEQLSGSETAPCSGRRGSDARRISGTQVDHLVKGSLMEQQQQQR